MGNLFKIFLLIGLLAGYTQTGSAIRCYSCTSESNEACGDDKLNLETKNELDCNTLNAPSFLGSALATGLSLLKSSATGCSKITSKINDKTAIVRTCFWGNVDDTSTCYDKDKNTDGVKMECNVCTNDLCNGATTTTTTYGIAVFLTALMGRFLF